MKLYIVAAFALIAVASACNFDEIPAHMKARLDRMVDMRQKWDSKWLEMSDRNHEHYEHVMLRGLERLPETERRRIHERISSMPEAEREKMREYLRKRFEVPEGSPYSEDSEDEIAQIITNIPHAIFEKIRDAINQRLREATAYNAEGDEIVDEELDFPDVPDMVEIPELNDESSPYSEEREEIIAQVDAFLMQREEWKAKWEMLSEQNKDCFEKYIAANKDN